MSNEVKKEIEEEEGVCRAAEDVCVMSVGASTFFFTAADISAVDLSCFLAALHFASL